VATTATGAPTKAAEPTKLAVPKVEYPVKGKPITVIVPFSAGGPTDISARLMAAAIEKEVGVPVQVLNKPGAGAQIGIGELARAKPDGYTIGAFIQPTASISYLDPANPPNYGRKDLLPLAMYALDSYVVAIKADSPYKTMKDLVDAAKAKPESIKFSTAGLTTASKLAVDLLAQQTGAKYALVNYDSGGQQLTAVLGDHVEATVPNLSVASPQVKNGAMRLLGVLSREKSSLFPEVETLASQGIDVFLDASYGINLPAGTPKEIQDVLSAAVKKSLVGVELKGRLEELNFIPTYRDSAAYNAHWDEVEAAIKKALSPATK